MCVYMKLWDKEPKCVEKIIGNPHHQVKVRLLTLAYPCLTLLELLLLAVFSQAAVKLV